MALKERLVRDGVAGGVGSFPWSSRIRWGVVLDHAEELEAAHPGRSWKRPAPRSWISSPTPWAAWRCGSFSGRGGVLPINRVAFLATPFQGTVTAHLAWGAGGPEMIPESEFLQELQTGWMAPATG